MSLEDTYDLDIRLKSARRSETVFTSEEQKRRDVLSKLPLCDFFQLPCVIGNEIYNSNLITLKTIARLGSKCWHSIDDFIELK